MFCYSSSSLYTRRNAGLQELSNLQDDEGKQPSRRGTRVHFGCSLTYSSSSCSVIPGMYESGAIERV